MNIISIIENMYALVKYILHTSQRTYCSLSNATHSATCLSNLLIHHQVRVGRADPILRDSLRSDCNVPHGVLGIKDCSGIPEMSR